MPRAKRKRPVRLLLTMGDPCGVGPELCVKALASRKLPADLALTVVGSRAVIAHAAKSGGTRLAARVAQSPAQKAGARAVLDVCDFPIEALRRRCPTAEGGRASIRCIETAVRLVLDGCADGIVTSPISKEAIGAAGSPHPGHTEMLGALSGVERPVMLLVSGPLRVAFVTTHLALRDVPRAITAVGIHHTGKVLAEALRRYFGIPEPSIAVCSLNPHAGDGGRFGDEEARLIAPAIEKLRRDGVNASGPLPSDTLFAKALRGEYNGVVAMYHDQGMVAVKLSGLADVVNVTLGLPFVRTSPGHGTAYDIAGTGVADVTSTAAAVRLAAGMVRVSLEHPPKSREAGR